MVGEGLALEIRVLAKHGKGVWEITREVGASRNTVRRYLRAADAVRYRARGRGGAGPASGDGAAAGIARARLRGRLHGAQGAPGPAVPAVPVLRFETGPGE